jgi:nitric-oxide synthase, bacterial
VSASRDYSLLDLPRRRPFRLRTVGRQAGRPAAAQPPEAPALAPDTAAEQAVDSESALASPITAPAAGLAADTALLAQAEQFITLFHTEHQSAGPAQDRITQVRREIEASGTYRHTAEELAFAARVAWRNSARCIGRLYWRSLQVRDRREVRSAAGVAAASFEHLRAATNGGRIRPLITLFAPD